MKIEVRYLSQTGNTKKIAEAIAKEAGVTAKSISEPLTGEMDILFLGGAVYGFTIDQKLRDFIKTLNPQSIKSVVVFSTTALVKSAYPKIKSALEEQGLQVSEKEFHCHGRYKILNKGRPNTDDCHNAEHFAALVIKRQPTDI